ncbi:uncharacterized protein LOC129749869 [Uranotaenia lowii]|uniref:uncharacterized protein LOC129749869 n=1 Tax=Uranotaenia lowii TaxID=190385 RepID=UPI002478597E|nr:uncharacterized protein LOC129749869 [Uranotaenia lowii]
MKKLIAIILLAVAVFATKECLEKAPFVTQDLVGSIHSNRVNRTLEAVFKKQGFNFTIIEGHTCRNVVNESVFWYHVILSQHDLRAEVSYILARNGTKRGRVDYLILDEDKLSFVVRTKTALIK